MILSHLLTTTLVKTVQNGNDTYEYSYDAVGNITQIKKNGSVYESYTYDGLNQLKTVTRGTDVYEYTYDSGANIQSVTLNGNTIKSYRSLICKNLIIIHIHIDVAMQIFQ